MWTPKQLFTTQSFFFCSTGDEERIDWFVSATGDGRRQPPLPWQAGQGIPEWEPILWGLGHRGVMQILTHWTSVSTLH